MGEYTIRLYESSKVVRPSILCELERKVSKGIYRGGFFATLTGDVYDDNDLLRRNILEGAVKAEPQSIILTMVEKELSWNLDYELGIAGIIMNNGEESTTPIGHVNFSSPKPVDELLKAHVQKYGGSIKDTRMGPAVVYPASMKEFQINAVLKAWG